MRVASVQNMMSPLPLGVGNFGAFWRVVISWLQVWCKSKKRKKEVKQNHTSTTTRSAWVARADELLLDGHLNIEFVSPAM